MTFAGQRFVQECICGTVGSERATVRKGIVSHSGVRFAAGAGVVAAALLVVGPNPAQAVADKHGSGHHSEEDRMGGSSGQRATTNRGSSSAGKDGSGFGGSGQDAYPDVAPPMMDLGSAGVELGDSPYVSTFAAPDEQATALRSAVVAGPAGDNVASATPRSGSGYSGQPATAFRAPRVVFGNGRTPGMHVPRAVSEGVLSFDSLYAPEAVPAAPAVPEAIEIDIPPLPPPLPPLERMRPAALVVGEFGIGTTDTVTDPLAGVAGLFLIPAIGVVLGYRQARAAQSLREKLRS